MSKRSIKLIIAIAIIFSSQLHAMSTERLTDKKIIIHMDVNGSIIFGDTSGGRTVEDSVKLALADDLKDKWDSSIKEPISYYDYVKLHLLPGSNSDTELRAKRTEKSLDLLHFLEKTNHRYAKIAQENYINMVAKLKTQKGSVFNSFYKLVDYLKKHKLNFTIILRSFGSDVDKVSSEINKTLGYEFFKMRGYFKGPELTYKSAESKEECLTSISDIYDFIKATDSGAIRDDYSYWNSHNEHQEFGKRFPLDKTDSSVISIFFDDNVKTDPKSLVNIVNPIDVKTCKPLKVSELIKSNNIVQVNGVKALLDDDYFIKEVQAA